MTYGGTTLGGSSLGSTSSGGFELTGTVTKDGGAVDGATVWATRGDTLEFVGATTTDANGNYSFQLPTDGYQVLVAVQYDDGTTKFGRAKSIQFSG
jgi:hypothetical protein